MTVTDALSGAYSVLQTLGLVDIIKAFLIIGLAGAFLVMVEKLRK